METKLSELELDAIREISNIGAGNAATVLSQIMNKKVDMTVPQVNIMKFEEMVSSIGDEDDETVAVLLKVFGDAKGNILYVMKKKDAEKTANFLLHGFGNVTEEIYLSSFQEIGNILGNSYLNAITKMTNLNMVSSVPAVAIDMLAAILTTSFMDAEQYSETILTMDTRFIQDDMESSGYFIFIPKPGSLEIILKNLGFN